MAALAAEVLEEWREAERALRSLPPDSVDYRRVAEAVEELRALYQRVTTTTIPGTEAVIAETRARVAETRELLRLVRPREPD